VTPREQLADKLQMLMAAAELGDSENVRRIADAIVDTYAPLHMKAVSA
jgi:hypothetical protein